MLPEEKKREMSDMNFIHIIHSLTKLFTLKHSCFSVNFTLKRSCKYAETLLRSIYTYIYLYKNTCSWTQQIVNNFFVNKLYIHFTGLIISSICLTSCYKQPCQPYRIIEPIGISQHLATRTSPAEFYVCSRNYLCVKPTAIWQAKDHPSNKRKGAFHVKRQNKNQCHVK